MTQFRKYIESLAISTNSLLTWEGNTALMIERGRNGKPSSNVWRKAFTFDGKNVTVKVRGKVMGIVPLAQLVRG